MSKLKKIILAVASATLIVLSASASACSIETKHPKAEIEISFSGKTYTLKYTLYRNMYPNTVRHFIELADNGFYNDMVIHDYKNTDWYTGGYSYAEDYEDYSATGAQMAQYLDGNSKESAYYELFNAGKFTPTVYSNVDYKTDSNGNIVYDKDNNFHGTQIVNKELALPTLIGEYSNNINQKILNGALSDGYGCLKMYYYGKESKSKVYVTPTDDQIIQADYKNNCATSLFALQVSSSSGNKANEYCIFATLRNEDVLKNLIEAVDEVFEELDDETVNTAMRVDTLESFSTENADKDMDQEFVVPTVPIIVKRVKITKY